MNDVTTLSGGSFFLPTGREFSARAGNSRPKPTWPGSHRSQAVSHRGGRFLAPEAGRNLNYLGWTRTDCQQRTSNTVTEPPHLPRGQDKLSKGIQVVFPEKIDVVDLRLLQTPKIKHPCKHSRGNYLCTPCTLPDFFFV